MRGPKDGPCDCLCHDHAQTLHVMACCHYTYEPRAQAEAKAAALRAASEVKAQEKPVLK